MPVIRVDMWTGKSDKQKQELISELTSAMERTLGTPPSAITVILNEVEPSHWGIAGKPSG